MWVNKEAKKEKKSENAPANEEIPRKKNTVYDINKELLSQGTLNKN